MGMNKTAGDWYRRGCGWGAGFLTGGLELAAPARFAPPSPLPPPLISPVDTGLAPALYRAAPSDLLWWAEVLFYLVTLAGVLGWLGLMAGPYRRNLAVGVGGGVGLTGLVYILAAPALSGWLYEILTLPAGTGVGGPQQALPLLGNDPWMPERTAAEIAGIGGWVISRVGCRQRGAPLAQPAAS